MLNVQDKIRTILYTEWGLTDPKLTDYQFKLDELDPKLEVPVKTLGNPDSVTYGNLQVVLENFPVRRIYISNTDEGKTYKVEHGCRITIFMKPLSYNMDVIDGTKTLFFNVKTEIDRILTKNKFSIEGITNIELSPNGWNDRDTIAVGRGIKTRKEPILWQSEQVVIAIYYEYGV